MPALILLSVILLQSPDVAPVTAVMDSALDSGKFDAVDAALHSPSVVANPGAAKHCAESKLAHASAAVRHLAAYVLCELDRERAKQALPTVIEALQSEEPRIRARVALALGHIGPAARDAIPALTWQLKDADPRARAGAARALGSFGAEARSAVPQLVTLLTDHEIPVRAVTALTLGQLGLTAKEAVPALRVVLRDDSDAEVRRLAAGALEDIDPSVPALRSALADPDAQRRLWAISALLEKGPTAREAVDAVTRVVRQDEEPAVRAGAALVLGKLGPEARGAGSALIDRLRDPIPRVRASAALALGLIGPGVEGSAAALAQALADPDSGVAESAATALGNLGPAAASAVPMVAGYLKEADAVRRRRAVNVLARIGAAARTAAPGLLDALRDPEIEIRRDACRALVSVGPQPAAPVTVLQEALRCHETPIDTQVRAWACLSLGALGPPACEALPALLDALQDDEASVRACAVIALGQVGPGAVPALVRQLEHLQPNVRLGSAQALGGQGAGARRAVEQLSRALHDEDARVGLAAAVALGRIAGALQLLQQPRDLPALQEVLAALDEDRPVAPGTPEEAQWQAAAKQVRTAITALTTAQRAHLFDRIFKSPWFVSLGGLSVYVSALACLWSLLLWLRPLALLQLGELLRHVPRVQVPVVAGNIELSLNHLLLLRFVQYRPRVLDAWVARCRETFRQNFEQKRVVQERKVHVPAPVVLDGQLLPAPEPKQIGQAFAGQRGCLLIDGDSGSGKTSLACRIAQWALAEQPAERLCAHPMLPVLIEPDADLTAAPSDSLVEIVRGQLQALVGPEHPVSAELLDALLRQRRVLVIVDRFSEMSAPGRDMLRPGRADFPVHALVVTSRRDEPLDGVPRCVVQPQRIDGPRLATFLEAYLTQRGKRHLFADTEHFDGCRQLAQLAGGRDISPLFARMYVELLIARKEGCADGQLPLNVPDLMLAYTLELNRGVLPARRRGDFEVLHDAETVAWQCVQRCLQPETVSSEETVSALGGPDARARLEYLEKDLGLVKMLGTARDQLCFTIEPLAEYLAALALIGRNRSDVGAWRAFLEQAKSSRGGKNEPRTFWLALCDCCRVRAVPVEVLGLLQSELAQAA